MEFDAVVVGSGPNGLAAAVEIARAGHSVCVVESRDTIGGGARTAELTAPGFLHDVCSAVHPLGAASPFFRSLPLAQHGVEWIHSPACLAHPFDQGSSAVLYQSIENTSATLGLDGAPYEKLFSVLARNSRELVQELLAPPIHLPRHPIPLMRFGIHAIQSAQRFSNRHFHLSRARGLFVGIAAHSNMPLDASPTAAFGLLLGMLGHAGGWPIVKGGSQKLSDALGSYFISLGGKIITGTHVSSLRQLPTSNAVIFDLTPRQVLKLTCEQLPPTSRWELQQYRYAPPVFKIVWALSSPIPSTPRDCLKAATLHLGATAEEIVAA